MKRVSELIDIDQIKTWNDGEVITIKAGTGAGKSYFIKNILYAFAKANNKKILFLIHRNNCVNQFKKELERDNKTDIIHIKTYQSLEQILLNNNNCALDGYKYIVSDEFHYFMGDASFNKTTDISLNKILSYTNAIKIFMSATGDSVKRYLNGIKKIETKNYELDINYNFIKELSFFYSDETMNNFARECIENGDKAIFFIQSAEKAYKLYSKFKGNCIFNCSKSNNKYYKYVDQKKIDDILANEKFEENILVTTTCMDAGVNIIDKDLCHIVCDVEDIGTLIQCIGRKRIQDSEDSINLYIKNITNQQLGGRETQLKLKIEKADFLREHTVKEYIERYPRSLDYTYITYDEVTDDDNCTKKINELMYYKVKIDLFYIQLMLAKGNKSVKFGYCKYIAQMFGFEKYRLIDEEDKNDELEVYLLNLIGKKLKKEQQQELINKIGLRDGRQRLQKSVQLLNAYLIKNTKFALNSKVVKETINNKRKNVTYWIVSKVS